MKKLIYFIIFIFSMSIASAQRITDMLEQAAAIKEIKKTTMDA